MPLPQIPESILRRIWQEQRFSQSHLATADGRAVTILAPGTPNNDAGPDFLDARIRVGTTTYRGDVELHVSAQEWLAHKHDRDPHYNRVILHVVLSAGPLSPPARTHSKRIVPLLVLHPFLDERTREAWSTLDEDRAQRGSIPCRDLNDGVSARVIYGWLETLGWERIELKVRRYEERLKQLVDEARRTVREPFPRYYGNPADIPPPRREYTRKDFVNKELWEQLLYEGIMEALGYTKNQKPFLHLAQSMPLAVLRRFPLDDTATMMALLFGAASLLPAASAVHERESRTYLAALKRRWRMLRRSVASDVLHEGDWLFFRLRPQNFPTARLAAFCFLLPSLFGKDAFRSLMETMKDGTLGAKERRARLHALFSFTPDPFWQAHYHFTSRKKPTTQRATNIGGAIDARSSGSFGIALGADRINDILVNAVVPFMLLYARIFREAGLTRNVHSLLAALPPLQDNAVSDIIRRDLLKQTAAFRLALHHQGAMQLYRFYCTAARCGDCAVGRRTSLGDPRREAGKD